MVAPFGISAIKQVSMVKGFVIALIACSFYCCSSRPARPQQKHDTVQKQEANFFTLIDSNQYKKIVEAIRNGANIERPNATGVRPLMYALYSEKNTLALDLISFGADVNLQDNIQNSAFLYAAATGNTAIVKACLDNGARFDVFNRYNGTGLIPAAEQGHVEVVKLLANTPGYPINHVNQLGWTALMEAVVLSDGGPAHVQVVDELIRAGADVNIPDKNGITALQHARKKGFTKIAALLTAAGGK